MLLRPRPWLVALLLAVPAAAQGAPFLADPLLQHMVSEALAKRPEVLQAQAAIDASRAQAGSAAALADPMLSVGIQNDGFDGLQVGKMENSYYSIMLEQTLPWPGKRGLRSDVREGAVKQGEADAARVRLGITAEVRRAYLDLLLVREQLKILGELETLWREAAGLARVRYETGEGAQSDVLRAQLENTRLKQRRWALEAEERRQSDVLNRLRAVPLGTPVTTTASLAGFSAAPLPVTTEAIAWAEAHSPELARARAAATQAQSAASLARKDYLPDYTLSAGLMPRGGDFPTMWQLGVGVNLPLWASQKQGREAAAAGARARGESQGAEAVRQLLHQRVAERITLLSSFLESWNLYKSGLLVQSNATAQSTLANYRVGDVTFASVLEALAGYLNDANGYFETIAAAERLVIAMDEISLEPAAAAASGGGMGAASIPGAGGGGAQGMRRASGGESSGM